MRALQGREPQGTADELKRVLEFLAADLPRAEFVDPANGANIISSDLSPDDKQEIARQARASLGRVRNSQWERVVG